MSVVLLRRVGSPKGLEGDVGLHAHRQVVRLHLSRTGTRVDGDGAAASVLPLVLGSVVQYYVVVRGLDEIARENKWNNVPSLEDRQHSCSMVSGGPRFLRSPEVFVQCEMENKNDNGREDEDEEDRAVRLCAVRAGVRTDMLRTCAFHFYLGNGDLVLAGSFCLGGQVSDGPGTAMLAQVQVILRPTVQSVSALLDGSHSLSPLAELTRGNRLVRLVSGPVVNAEDREASYSRLRVDRLRSILAHVPRRCPCDVGGGGQHVCVPKREKNSSGESKQRAAVAMRSLVDGAVFGTSRWRVRAPVEVRLELVTGPADKTGPVVVVALRAENQQSSEVVLEAVRVRVREPLVAFADAVRCETDLPVTLGASEAAFVLLSGKRSALGSGALDVVVEVTTADSNSCQLVLRVKDESFRGGHV